MREIIFMESRRLVVVVGGVADQVIKAGRPPNFATGSRKTKR